MKRLFQILACIAILTNSALAQFSISLETQNQVLIDDEAIQISEEDAKYRFRNNTYLTMSYGISDFSFGLQLESFLPYVLLNYNPELATKKWYDIFGSVYARYSNTKIGLDVTVGHFYEQFGNGLVLRTYEDRQLGINSSIFGTRLKYTPIEGINLTVLGGKQRIGNGFELSGGWDFNKGMILGGDADINLSHLAKIQNHDINLGFSYVGRYEDQSEFYPSADLMVNAFSGRVNYAYNNFSAEAEYVFKTKDLYYDLSAEQIVPRTAFNGQAILLNFGYTQKGVGVNLSLRTAENMGFYSERQLGNNIYNRGSLNFTPALTKQYDFLLQNIYVYQSQTHLSFSPVEKVGEIGGQLDFFYDFKKGSALGGKYGTHIAVNASYYDGLRIDTMNLDERFYKSSLFAFGGTHAYHDVGLELRKKLSKDFTFIAMYLYQYYNKQYIEERYGQFHAHTLSFEGEAKLTKKMSLKFDVQHQFANKNGDYGGNWLGGSLEWYINRNWSVFASDMWNYGNANPEEKIHYYNTGLNFVWRTIRVSASYGRQRGGLLCVGGVCRQVSESNGLTLGITASF